MKLLELSEISLVEIAEPYRQLKQSGHEFLGRCISPSHIDRNPSMFINPQKNVFKCMSCGVGGGVLEFIRLLLNTKDTKKAIKHIEDHHGIKIKRQRAGDTVRKELEILDWAHQEFMKHLEEMYKLKDATNPMAEYASAFRLFLAERGLTIFQVRKFELGLAPQFGGLKGGYKEEELRKAGLVFMNDPSEIFKSRLMFPIKDEYGRVRGFSGRTIFRAKQKYLNSPSSSVFDKNSLVFHGEILSNTDVEEVVIVEGPIDAIVASEYFPNVIAKQGSALTEGMIKKLEKNVNKVRLFYDGDQAGSDALLKDLVNLSKTDLILQVIPCPETWDPGSLSADHYLNLKTYDLVNWYIRRFIDIDIEVIREEVYDVRKDYVDQFLRVFKGCNHKYVRSICEVFNVDIPEQKPTEVKLEVAKIEKPSVISQVELDMLYAMCYLYERDETIEALLLLKDVGFEIFHSELRDPIRKFSREIAFGRARPFYPITKNPEIDAEIKSSMQRSFSLHVNDYDMTNFLVCIVKWVEAYKLASTSQVNLDTVKETPALRLAEKIHLKRHKLGGL